MFNNSVKEHPLIMKYGKNDEMLTYILPFKLVLKISTAGYNTRF